MNYVKAVHLSRYVNAVVRMPPLAAQCCDWEEARDELLRLLCGNQINTYLLLMRLIR